MGNIPDYNSRQSIASRKSKSLDLKDLERYPEYLDFKGRTRTESKALEPESDSTTVQETPEEELERTYTAIRVRLEGELLDALKTSSPIFFEKVVLALLVSMGYGGSIEDAAKTTRRTGDDGIDGVIKEDRLGLDVVHIQAKRWTSNVVGRPDLQNFAGSLEGQRGRKGVFITTSSFSKEAREFVLRIEKKIILIDGVAFARLCVEFGVGVLNHTSYIVKKIDQEFFNEE